MHAAADFTYADCLRSHMCKPANAFPLHVVCLTHYIERTIGYADHWPRLALFIYSYDLKWLHLNLLPFCQISTTLYLP